MNHILEKTIYGETMKNKITGILLIVILVFANLNVVLYAKETPDELKNLYAQSAVLMDADSGRILFGKNENAVLPMASTTKIMTCIIALERMREDQIGKVTTYAVRQPKVHLGMQEGESYYLEDLLYSLMLESHNDSAVVIAEAIGGSVEEFAEMMNKKAVEIGCTDTFFITPNGLDAENDIGAHATTAQDLALIMSYCVQRSPMKEEFISITQTRSYHFSDIDGKRNFVCNNHNSFLEMMEEAISGKTGYTNAAGYCYVGAVRDGDRTFVVALLACGWPNNKGYKWQDTKKLMRYALEKYEYQDISGTIKTDNINIKNGMDHADYFNRNVFAETKVSESDSKINVLLCEDDKIETKIVQKTFLYAPVQAGEHTGTVYYLLNGDVVARKDIIITESIDMADMKGYLSCLFSMYFM